MRPNELATGNLHGGICHRETHPRSCDTGKCPGSPLQWAFGKGLARGSTDNSRQAGTGQLFTRANDGFWVTDARDHEEVFGKCRGSSYKGHGIKWLLLGITGALKKTMKIAVINHQI